ncbi:mitosis inhibitor protein kinase SWE1, partial [Tremellales sp. Uapishka_1]
MSRNTTASASASTSSSTGPNSTFKVPRTKNLNRPTTWFASTSASSSSSSSTASTSSANLINPFNPTFKSPFPTSKGKHKLSPSPSPRAKHGEEGDDFVMVSVSPIRSVVRDSSSSSPPEDSPTPACGMTNATAKLKLQDDDSPIRRVPGQSRSLARPGGGNIFLSAESLKSTHEEVEWIRRPRKAPASPLKFSTTNLMSMSMEDGETSPGLPPTPSAMPPQPLFPILRPSNSADSSTSVFSNGSGSKMVKIEHESRIPRLSHSHPLRARASTEADHRPMLGQKKATSLDQIPMASRDEPFGIPFGVTLNPAKARRSTGGLSGTGRPHKRIPSGENLPSHMAAAQSISRSAGHKSGLALSLSPTLPQPEFSASNSSLSSNSTCANAMTPMSSAFSPIQPPIFEHVKPLQEAFQTSSAALGRKFKPRDSGVSMGEEEDIPSASLLKPKRPTMLKRTSSLGDERGRELQVETPSCGPSMGSGWPGGPGGFDFLGESAVGLGFGSSEKKLEMPGTPVKKHAFVLPHPHSKIGHSTSQPTLASTATAGPTPLGSSTVDNLPSPPKAVVPPPSVLKAPSTLKTAHLGSARTSHDVLHLTLTTSSPGSPMDTDEPSPTVRMTQLPSGLGTKQGPISRVGMLRRLSSGVASGNETSEDEETPTKGGGERALLGPRQERVTPSPSPKPLEQAKKTAPLMPRLSLPAFAAPKLHRKLNHRQSHPPPGCTQLEEDLYEKRFITLETLGKGAFSTVMKVQERDGEGIYAVKKARGVFDGVKDRLRHLEEVDILRHLSKTPCPHVIRFVDAWEQNRQLFIQTELCLGSLAFFLEEYGRVVERLDEGRVWKIVRELSDGINHIHSNGVIHFDIKPANILISASGSLKIGDFGLATRWPRVDPATILEGSGLGGNAFVGRPEKLEREGDRVYMPPEMLRGQFVMPADIYSFGLVILEVSTNICVPDGGQPWQALRSDDFSVVDLSPLSPALTDLIIKCMNSNPAQRPTIQHLVTHPIVQRARTGKDALAPEDPRWLVEVLAGSFSGEVDVDVEMGDA